MKPQWKDSPPWAKWLAMDSSGLWCWFEHQPVKHATMWIASAGRANEHTDALPWHESLEPRPEVAND